MLNFIIVFTIPLLVPVVVGQECGGLLQECCCETNNRVMEYPPDNATDFMVGLPPWGQSGCCESQEHVCISTEYSVDGVDYVVGTASGFMCYPKSVVKDIAFSKTNTIYKGDYSLTIGSHNQHPSVEHCEASCKFTEACDVYVYCPLEDGCTISETEVISYRSCELKVSKGVRSGYPPQVSATGPDIDFTSGYVKRSAGCGQEEGSACCPSQSNKLRGIDSSKNLPGGCNMENLYCDYSAKDKDSVLGYCKKVNKSKACGAEYGLCDAVCGQDGFEMSCPEGFDCISIPYFGIPGYSVEDATTTYCVEM
eukprot:TRINITY_DN4889_c0_g1_i11.p3 TRINITY_DN4889_c0_g1~~TRINITY_DN4889_c0_g1_i11.p3  ORF type:complete len:309 (-),score=23.79 TRINITY_DN4889_c0_g1_i11:490-1416(-)